MIEDESRRRKLLEKMGKDLDIGKEGARRVIEWLGYQSLGYQSLVDKEPGRREVQRVEGVEDPNEEDGERR